MIKGEFINLNDKSIEFEIVPYSKGKQALAVYINGLRYIYGVFKERDDAWSAYLDIVDDYSNEMNELFCRKG